MRKVGVLLRELSDDEDEPFLNATPATIGNLSELWLPGFNNYWTSSDHLGDISIVEWWSVRGTTMCCQALLFFLIITHFL